jgi:hypothetical protein
MATKFVSKNSNYMVVLRSGLEGNRALGTHAINGLYVRFLEGVADIKDDTIVKMLKDHPGFGTDFLEVKHDEIDPYKDERQEIEPTHATAQIKYGHVESASGSQPKVKMTPQMKKLLEKEALKMLPGLLKANPALLKDLVLELAAGMKAKEDAENLKKEPPTELKSDENGNTDPLA